MESLRRFVLADLERGMRLMLRVQDEIDPQFRIATPEGDVALAVTFSDNLSEKQSMFDRVRRFCAWKQALAYTMTFNINEPQALMTVGVSGAEVIGCLLRFEGEHGSYSEESFGLPGWVPAASIGEELAGLLPSRSTELTSEDLSELQQWFGAEGRFPAVNVASGRMGL